MAQAIITKFVGPTDKRASRVSVKGWMGNKLVLWDSSVGSEENHALAAAFYIFELNKKRDPTDDFEFRVVSGGGMPDSSGYAFIIDLVWKGADYNPVKVV
jgi:hypothetical protein